MAGLVAAGLVAVEQAGTGKSDQDFKIYRTCPKFARDHFLHDFKRVLCLRDLREGLYKSKVSTMSVQQTAIYVASSELHGQGVFAARDIEEGEIIEICPILLIPKSELHHIRQTMLDNYYFDWGDDGEWYALALGYGSLYNHEYDPNADYGMDFEANTIDIYCLRTIKAGEEICINYNGEPGNLSPVWFEK